MAVYRLDLTYHGAEFRGYARQPGQTTVQGELERALSVFGYPVATAVAGRTDAGVHARGQVVSFEWAEDLLDCDRLQRSLNGRLGPAIAVTAARQAPDGFNARFSATWRSYRYLVLNEPIHDPMLAATAWHVPDPLDFHAMNVAAAHFVGTHDFASFCRAQEGRSTEREVHAAEWARVDEFLIRFDIVASSFCQQMVRSVVALCVEVGRGRFEAAAVPGIIAARDRNAAGGVAPPHGLTLMEVGYDDGGV